MIAVDMPNQRIYVRGDMHQAYSWLMERFKEDWAHILRNHHFPIFWLWKDERSEDHEWQARAGWTIEHNPEPL